MIPVPMPQSTPLYQANAVELAYAQTPLNRGFWVPAAVDTWHLPQGMFVLPGLVGHPDAAGEIASYTVLLRTWLVAHPAGMVPVQCERQEIARSTATAFAETVATGRLDLGRPDDVDRWCQQWSQRPGVHLVPDWRAW